MINAEKRSAEPCLPKSNKPSMKSATASTRSGTIFDLATKEDRLKELESIIAKEGFWDNPEKTKPILKERTSLSNKIEKFKKLADDLEENEILLGLAVDESDEETLAEVAKQISGLDQRIAALSLELMLVGEDDAHRRGVVGNAVGRLGVVAAARGGPCHALPSAT